jgi:hypothetical protein
MLQASWTRGSGTEIFIRRPNLKFKKDTKYKTLGSSQKKNVNERAPGMSVKWMTFMV